MKIRAGTVGWVGLTAYVAVWDAYAPETLSGAFGRAVLHPKARWPVVALWGLTTAHLFGVLPRRYDPIARVGYALRNARFPT